MAMTLAEQLLLIALDEARGTVSTRMNLDTGLAAALITDLARRGVLVTDENDDLNVPETPSGLSGALGDVARAIHAGNPPRGEIVWVVRLPRLLKPIRERVATALVAQGVLSERRSKVLGLIPRTRYPTANPTFVRELRRGLHAALTGRREPTEDEALLLPLLYSYRFVEGLVTEAERPAAKARAAEIARRGAASEAVAASAAAAQAAALAITLASGHAGGGDAGGGGGGHGGGGHGG